MRLMELSPVYPVQKFCKSGLKQGEIGDLSRIHYEDNIMSSALNRILFQYSFRIASEYLLSTAADQISINSSAIMLCRYYDYSVISKIIGRIYQSHSWT